MWIFKRMKRQRNTGTAQPGVVQTFVPLRNRIILLALYGLAAGSILAILPEIRLSVIGIKRDSGITLDRTSWIILCSLLGAAVGSLIIPAYRRLFRSGRDFAVESVKVTLFGADINVKLTNQNKVITWKIFVEAATRITTRSLGENEGVVREALQSMYLFFKLVRDELKTATPALSLTETKEHTLETYGVLMLNDALRPLLARWHPRLLAWEKTERPESQWPLNSACRLDLETARRKLLVYTRGLGTMLHIAKLGELLPAEEADRAFLTDKEVLLLEKATGLSIILSDTQRQQFWNIFVETGTRVVALPLGWHDGALRQALTSFQELFSLVRTELRGTLPGAPYITALGPSSERADALTHTRLEPEALGGFRAGHNPAAIAPHYLLRPEGARAGIICEPNPHAAYLYAIVMLNKGLHPLLARWHPRLLAWEKTGRPESQWPLNNDCRRDFEVAGKIVLIHLWRIGELLHVPCLGDLLPTKPQETEAALRFRWTPDEQIRKAEEKIRHEPGNDAKIIGWHIFVELASRVATQPLKPGTGGLRQAIDSLYKLYEVVRTELKGLTTEHLTTRREGDTIEGIALEVLNGPLRRFLDEWHPLLLAWEEQNEHGSEKKAEPERLKAECEWSEAGDCLKQLEEVRLDVTVKAIRLGKLIGIAEVDKLLKAQG